MRNGFCRGHPAKAEGLTLSGGLDGRTEYSSTEGEEAELRGLFLNLRKVWQDEGADRWIGVAQLDVEHNFSEVQPYQVYLQYKGPLGKWNVRAGHFLVPFGLLATYDTERLLLGGIEDLSLGLRHDTGVQWFGRVGDWDYALAVTDGLGVTSLFDGRANPVVSGRVALVRDQWQVGLSVLSGRVVFAETRDFGWDDERGRHPRRHRLVVGGCGKKPLHRALRVAPDAHIRSRGRERHEPCQGRG